MIMFILACIVSFIPCIALFLWLRNHTKGDEPAFKKLCDTAMVRGILAVLPIVLLSGSSYVLLRFTKLQDTSPLLYQALYTFIVLAFMEELAKYLAFRGVLKKTDYPCSWLDVTVIMTIVGIGFGLIESVTYAFGASIPVVLVRGISVPHAGFGFIVGYFYGKAMETGKPFYKGFGFALSWLLHGLYDFSLSQEFIAINENLMFVGLSLALLDIVLVIMAIAFVRRARRCKRICKAII